jgi:hypothetical protein
MEYPTCTDHAKSLEGEREIGGRVRVLNGRIAAAHPGKLRPNL